MVLRLLVPALALAAVIRAQGCVQGAPCYSEAGIVNAATFQSGALAPNMLATLYGTGLSFNTRAVSGADTLGGRMPVQLGSVVVSIDGESAPLYYVSPEQINFVVPATTAASTVVLRVLREGRAGPEVRVGIADAAPALFQCGEWACATHADGTVLSAEAPAKADETIILYAAGLGALVWDGAQPVSEIPKRAIPLKRAAAFRAELGGRPLDAERVVYVGSAPGFLGLYQVNLVLPADLSATGIRVGFDGNMSDPGRIPIAP